MKVIRLQQVMEMTGLGRSTIYKYVSESWFPSHDTGGAGMKIYVAPWVQCSHYGSYHYNRKPHHLQLG